MRAATLAGKTTGGGEADATDRAGVEFLLSTNRDLYPINLALAMTILQREPSGSVGSPL